jgi:hypothetical protein
MALVHLVSKDDYEREGSTASPERPGCLAPLFRDRSARRFWKRTAKGSTSSASKRAALTNSRSSTSRTAPARRRAPSTPGITTGSRLTSSACRAAGTSTRPERRRRRPELVSPGRGNLQVARSRLGRRLDHFKDWPHWQFGGLSATPKDAVTILATRGIRAVWETVGAAA